MPEEHAPEYLGAPIDYSTPEFVASYDELPLWSAMFGQLLLEHVPLRPGITALDIGCGTGFPLLELAQRLGPRSRVIGADPWAAALERARQKAAAWGVSNVELLPADAVSLPLPDSSVDLIVSNLGVNNFADPAAVLRECCRVGRPGATLAITTNLRGHFRELYAAFAEVLEAGGHAEAGPALRAHVDHRATVESLAALLSAADLQVRRIVEREASMRFADGGALLRHSFIRLAFLDGWRSVVPPAHEGAIFLALERALDSIAAAEGELRLTVPMAYVEAALRSR
jgi:ubiquinone/menaquinone biosynthesis C-methylase UbiE